MVGYLQFIDDAIRLLRKSLLLQEHNAKALAQLVFLYKTAGDAVKAREVLDTMERYTPDHDSIKHMRQLLLAV
jgi:hypothetical protein